MKTVFDALYTKFTGSALSVAVGGRYFETEAEPGTALPYVVASIISDLPRHELSHTFVDLLIEISVVAVDLPGMYTVTALAHTLFDNCALSLSGWQQVGLFTWDSETPLKEDGGRRNVIEYRLQLKNL